MYGLHQALYRKGGMALKKTAYGLLIVICLGGISFAEVPTHGQSPGKNQAPTHGWRYLSKEKCKLLYLEGTNDYNAPRDQELVDSLKNYSKTRATEILAKYSIRHPGAVEEGAYCFEGGYKDKRSGKYIVGGERFYEEFWRSRRSR